MCLAIPGKVKEIDGMKAVIEYPHEERQVLVGEEDVQVGDLVMVQMGIIVKILSPEEAQAALKAWKI